jgi:(R,R)-butanediol dehydrogenase/meso-butanediol dehydrogenase/diacetyl reductase
VCLIGIGGATEFEITRDFIHKQLTVHGSWTLGVLEQAECARFVVDRAIPLHRIYTHRFRLEEAAQAPPLLREGHLSRVLATSPLRTRA